MKYSKIIYVFRHPYAIRDHHRFGADYLEKCGYCVEIWRVTDANSLRMDFTAGMYNGNNYREISQENYLIEIKNNKSALFIFNGMGNLLTEVAGEGCNYICTEGVVGVCVPDQSELSSFATLTPISAYSGFVNRLKGGLLNYLKFRLKRISELQSSQKTKEALRSNPPLSIITSTQYVSQLYLPENEHVGNIRYVHSMDYDRFIETERKGALSDCMHILYCDSGFFNKNQDWELSGRDNGRGYIKEFHKQLESLFTLLEDFYGLPIVIAGHPHAEYSDGDFNGRKIVFDQTCDLTKNSVAFITTTSTAMNFALLYNIPSLKIVNNYMKRIRYPYENSSDLYAYIKYEALNLFGCGLLDMDDAESMKEPWKYVKTFEPQKREDYIRDYIIDNDTTDQTLIEYIVDEVLN